MKTIQIAVLIAVAGLGLSQPAFAKTHPHARQKNQEARIQQGVKSGELTKGEAKDLQKDHRAIGKEIRADKAANGGGKDRCARGAGREPRGGRAESAMGADQSGPVLF